MSGEDGGERRGFHDARGPSHPSGSLPVYVSLPAADHPAPPTAGWPVVVVAHHGVGIFQHTFLRQFADNLALAGYAAALPDYYSRCWTGTAEPQASTRGEGLTQEQMDLGGLIGQVTDNNLVEDTADALALLGTLEVSHSPPRRPPQAPATASVPLASCRAAMPRANRESASA